MITKSRLEIDAPVSTVWGVYTDIERWPEWTSSVTRVVPLDGPDLEVGRRFRIRQPRFPELDWTVTSVDPGRGWTWEQRSPGGRTVAVHEVTPLGEGRTAVRQGVDQRGPLGVLVGVVARRLSRRYLDAEAHGLKARSEAVHRTTPA